MDEATRRDYVRARLAKAQEETTRVVADAERFVARLERYLREEGAI